MSIDVFQINIIGILCVITLSFICCSNVEINNDLDSKSIVHRIYSDTAQIYGGAYRLKKYVPLLKEKKVAVVVNHTSTIYDTHLVDTLLTLDISVKAIFAPEHGFRGTLDAGEKVENKIDQSGIPIYSLYGKSKQPSKEQLQDIDILLFDIQDVGVRYYTYISTLHLVMLSAAMYDIPIIVLDRPNPNGHYIDGPVLENELKSFVGMHNVPIVYGMTIGEYAKMINGENWLGMDLNVDLKVISCLNYAHDKFYSLPVRPSPNLKDDLAILLYPSLCLFEGTHISVGRGTQNPFKMLGHPDWKDQQYKFIPQAMLGAKYPKHKNLQCFGISMENENFDSLYNMKRINLEYLINAYNEHKNTDESFFLNNNFFDKLAGTYNLRNQLIAGTSAQEIRNSWQKDIKKFQRIRKKYLLYN